MNTYAEIISAKLQQSGFKNIFDVFKASETKKSRK